MKTKEVKDVRFVGAGVLLVIGSILIITGVCTTERLTEIIVTFTGTVLISIAGIVVGIYYNETSQLKNEKRAAVFIKNHCNSLLEELNADMEYYKSDRTINSLRKYCTHVVGIMNSLDFIGCDYNTDTKSQNIEPEKEVWNELNNMEEDIEKTP